MMRMVITISHEGYIKRLPAGHVPRAAPRRTRADRCDVREEDDWVEHLYVGLTHDYLMVFTTGRVTVTGSRCTRFRWPAAMHAASRS